MRVGRNARSPTDLSGLSADRARGEATFRRLIKFELTLPALRNTLIRSLYRFTRVQICIRFHTLYGTMNWFANTRMLKSVTQNSLDSTTWTNTI